MNKQRLIDWLIDRSIDRLIFKGILYSIPKIV